MSLLKLMPIAALALAGAGGFNALKKNADVIGKFKVLATQNVEMQGIAGAVANAYTETETLPLDNFPAFLKANLREARGGDKRDRSKDLWGTEYRLVRVKNGFEVRCAGPDTTWGTADDLNKFYELAGLGPVPATTELLGPAVSPPNAKLAARTAPPSRSRPTQSQEETKRKVLDHQKRLAEQGYPSAQYDLGVRYLTGDGVEKNPDLAREWLRKSAQKGNADAARKLSQLAGTPP